MGGGGPFRGQQCLLSLLCHRVEVIAKQLGGLREQEKRIRGLESQVGCQPDPPPG